MAPLVGRSYPESRFSKVVFPHPDGPTTATNSPRLISNESFCRTVRVPKLRETSLTRMRLSLIAPPHAWDARQLDEQPIDDNPDQSDNHHSDYDQVVPEAVSGVPYEKAEPVPSCDHLRCHYD